MNVVHKILKEAYIVLISKDQDTFKLMIVSNKFRNHHKMMLRLVLHKNKNYLKQVTLRGSWISIKSKPT